MSSLVNVAQRINTEAQAKKDLTTARTKHKKKNGKHKAYIVLCFLVNICTSRPKQNIVIGQ